MPHGNSAGSLQIQSRTENRPAVHSQAACGHAAAPAMPSVGAGVPGAGCAAARGVGPGQETHARRAGMLHAPAQHCVFPCLCEMGSIEAHRLASLACTSKPASVIAFAWETQRRQVTAAAGAVRSRASLDSTHLMQRGLSVWLARCRGSQRPSRPANNSRGRTLSMDKQHARLWRLNETFMHCFPSYVSASCPRQPCQRRRCAAATQNGSSGQAPALCLPHC